MKIGEAIHIVIEKLKERGSKVFVYTMIYMLIARIMLMIPYVNVVFAIFMIFFSVGFIQQIINMYNGKEEPPFAFFYNWEEKWKTILGCGLRLFLKNLFAEVCIFVGMMILVFYFVSSFANLLYQTHVGESMVLWAIFGFLLMVVGIIKTYQFMLKYVTVIYELIHDDENQSSKKLLEQAYKAKRDLRIKFILTMIIWGAIVAIEVIVVEVLLQQLGWQDNELLVSSLNFLIVALNTPFLYLVQEELYQSEREKEKKNHPIENIPVMVESQDIPVKVEQEEQVYKHTFSTKE